MSVNGSVSKHGWCEWIISIHYTSLFNITIISELEANRTDSAYSQYQVSTKPEDTRVESTKKITRWIGISMEPYYFLIVTSPNESESRRTGSERHLHRMRTNIACYLKTASKINGRRLHFLRASLLYETDSLLLENIPFDIMSPVS
jgi:hypothetical protein